MQSILFAVRFIENFGTQIVSAEVQSQPNKISSYCDLLTIPFINALNPQGIAKYRMLACGFPGGGGGAESPDLREKRRATWVLLDNAFFVLDISNFFPSTGKNTQKQVIRIH